MVMDLRTKNYQKTNQGHVYKEIGVSLQPHTRLDLETVIIFHRENFSIILPNTYIMKMFITPHVR